MPPLPDPAAHPAAESSAFAALYTAYRVTLARLLLHQFPSLDRETADELVQGVYLEVWSGNAARRTRLLASTPAQQDQYLSLMAHSRALDLLRRRQRRGVVYSLEALPPYAGAQANAADPDLVLADTLTDDDLWAQPERAALARDALRHGMAHLDGLKPSHQEIVRLVLAGWRINAIAAHLGVNHSVVSTILSRIHAHLIRAHLRADPAPSTPATPKEQTR